MATTTRSNTMRQLDGLVVRYISPAKGKGMFTTKPIKKGDVILEEKPLVCAQFAWNETYKYRACEYCLRSLETAEEMARRLTANPGITLPYPECCDVQQERYVVCPHCQVEYCSESCREKAWAQYHQVLCMGPSREDPEHPFARLQEVWRSIHFPPESTSITLIMKMIAMVKQAEDKSEIIDLFSGFVHTFINEEDGIAHKLIGAQFKEQRELLREMLMSLMFEESVQEWFIPDGFSSLFALIGTNAQGIGSSSLSRWVKKVEKLKLTKKGRASVDKFIQKMYDATWKVVGPYLDCDGSGLYTLQSACNHSCRPNAEVTFPYGDHTLALVASEDIEPDEEICITYLGCCDLGSNRHGRQKVLRDNYLFHCECDRCIEQADEESITSESSIEEESDEDGWEDDDEEEGNEDDDDEEEV